MIIYRFGFLKILFFGPHSDSFSSVQRYESFKRQIRLQNGDMDWPRKQSIVEPNIEQIEELLSLSFYFIFFYVVEKGHF
uniref:Uncharacterized protein n=1 Tax=Noccaea caerulescens TaxID=107243 RepID=A0A1J3CBF6_NOCCA